MRPATHTSERPVAAGRIAETQALNGLDFPTTERTRKAFATLAARAALLGYELHPVTEGFMLCRLDSLARLETLDDVAEWLGLEGMQ